MARREKGESQLGTGPNCRRIPRLWGAVCTLAPITDNCSLRIDPFLLLIWSLSNKLNQSAYHYPGLPNKVQRCQQGGINVGAGQGSEAEVFVWVEDALTGKNSISQSISDCLPRTPTLLLSNSLTILINYSELNRRQKFQSVAVSFTLITI